MAKNKSKVEEFDDDLELMEDDEVEETKPAKKGKSKKAVADDKPAKAEKAPRNDTGMGAGWLAEHINEELGTELTAAHVRVILRKMAADGELEREVGSDRTRYSFTGENDKVVKAVLKRVKAGEGDVKETRIKEARANEPTGKRKAKEEAVTDKPTKKAKRVKAEDDDAEEAPKKKVRRQRASAE